LENSPEKSTARVNLILFDPIELERPLPRSDRRAAHILNVLRRQVGEMFDVGVINGPRGKATVASIGVNSLEFMFAWGPPPNPLDAITLLIGLPRPQTARDILRDATTLGVSALHFARTEKSERSYAQSTLWSSGEWRRHLITGAEQAFDTRLPEITHGRNLEEVLALLPATGERLALDNYESATSLGSFHVIRENHYVLAVGGERGWSAGERATLRAQGFRFVHLGARVLRTETAVTSGVSILRAKLGLM
jgi:16S rRNA (uracil1498-N3)-methyltransferase